MIKFLISLRPEDKEDLEAKAKKMGLTLTGYIRMVLLKSLS